MSNQQQYGNNPYGSDGADPNPYGNNPSDPHEMGNLNAPPQAAAHVLGTQDFLARVDGCKGRIGQLTSLVGEISTVHQRMLSDSASAGSQQQLEHLATQSSVLNAQIKDEIKFLETDAARTGGNATKDSQVRILKDSFRRELENYRTVETRYRARYREQIARHISIVSPELSGEEVERLVDDEDATENIFQRALTNDRSGHASSALGAVRARSNDIKVVVKKLEELNVLFQQMNEQVVLQEPLVERSERQTENVLEQGKQAHVELDKGIDHIKRRNRLRRWVLFVCILIICIVALVLGLYFGLRRGNNTNNNSSNNGA